MANNFVFAKLEKEIFRIFCEKAREYTANLLEEYDDELYKNRDKAKHKVVGKYKTTVKTLFGEVEFKRRRYARCVDGETVDNVYLLDVALEIFCVGKVSSTLANLIATAAAQQSFRRAAQAVSLMTGQTISHGAVWNVIQSLGQEAATKEDIAVLRLKDNVTAGKETTAVLFEEADGVFISLQGKDRKQQRRKSKELKVSLAYRGCFNDGKRTKLLGKVAFAGFYSTKDFHLRREAMIRHKYDIDNVKLRVLNGDGASWVKNTFDKESIYQLDNFHIQQEMTRCIKHGKIRNHARKLLRECKIEECLNYIETYKNSVSGDRAEAVERLYNYLKNNKNGLIPYYKRGIDIPQPPKDVFYKNLGTMENHNFSMITQRMKHNRGSWSISGANNMVKVLTERENGTLEETISSYFLQTKTELLNLKIAVPETINEDCIYIKGFSCAGTQKRIGSGYMPKQGNLFVKR